MIGQKWRLGLLISGLRTEVIHEANCPEIAPPQCAAEELPAHLHHQKLNFFQLNLNVSRQLPFGFQLEGSIPIDIKNSSIDYRLLEDDSPYNPPYAGIHHRNETLLGFGDAYVGFVYYHLVDKWVFGAGGGTTFPLGKTESNPYELAAEGLSHQHFQMGSGVFSPRLNISAIYNNMRWGLLNSAMAQFSLYGNDKGYAPGNKYRVNIGPWWVQTPRLRYLFSLSGIYEEPETWSGSAAPNSGKKALGLSGAIMWRYKPDLEMSFRMERNLIQSVVNESDIYQNDQIPAAIIFSIGLNYWR